MRKRSKKLRLSKNQPQKGMVVGVAWHTSEQFEHLKAVADDADSLDETYDDWLNNASRLVRRLTKQGLQVVKTPFDVDEWLTWCEETGEPLNGESRSRFTSMKTVERYKADSSSDRFISKEIKPRRGSMPLLQKLEALFEAERDTSVKPLFPLDPDLNIIRLPATVVDDLRQLARSGKKIEAVQQVTKLTGAGLRVSKDYVDSLFD
jgi:hypothetical protein